MVRSIKARKAKSGASKPIVLVTRDYTVNLRSALHGRTFKTRAPSAIKALVKFAQKATKVTKVNIDPTLNAALWDRGVKCIKPRIRVRIEMKRNSEFEATSLIYAVVKHVPVSSFKGLHTEVVEEDSQRTEEE